MGNNTSQQTKVFTPTTPVEFSSSFLAQLEGSDSDYARSQYTEKYIQQRVSQELKKLEDDVKQKFKEKLDETDANNNSDNSVSFESSNERILKLTKVLEDNINLSKVEVSDEVKNTRSAVVECLKNNKGKVLNCWDEVDSFKQLVKDL